MELALIVIATMAVIGTAFLVPTARQVQRTAARAEALIETLQRHVDPLANEARETIEQVRRTAAAAEITAVRVAGPLQQAVDILLTVSAWKNAVSRTVESQKEVVGVLFDATRKAIGGFVGRERRKRLPGSRNSRT
jgi:uncharacterized protein YoxC